MKHNRTYTTLLGITQLELAMILQVSRPLVTRFELGQRDLPQQAKILLAEMLTHMQSAQMAAKKDEDRQEQHKQAEVHFRKLQTTNELERLLIARKIKRLEDKLEADWRRAQLYAFFERREQLDPKSNRKPVFRKQTTTDSASKKSKATQLAELYHKQDLLVYEAGLLESKLGKDASTVIKNKD